MDKTTVEIYLSGELLVRVQSLSRDLSELGIGYVILRSSREVSGIRVESSGGDLKGALRTLGGLTSTWPPPRRG